MEWGRILKDTAPFSEESSCGIKRTYPGIRPEETLRAGFPGMKECKRVELLKSAGKCHVFLKNRQNPQTVFSLGRELHNIVAGEGIPLD